MGEVAFPREKHTNRLSIGQTISPENIHAGRTIWTGQVLLRNAIIISEKKEVMSMIASKRYIGKDRCNKL